jgi:quercetin dioxygenase-like cupin family protein
MAYPVFLSEGQGDKARLNAPSWMELRTFPTDRSPSTNVEWNSLLRSATLDPAGASPTEGARQSANADVQIVDVAFAPGGYTGWHSHPGTEVVTVKTGAVTLKRVREGECRIHTYTAGQGFPAG